jgi:hypothetical protein
MADQEKINQHAQDKEQHGRERSEGGGAELADRECPEGDVHAEHDELAMGEVDHVHHAPDERQAG